MERGAFIFIVTVIAVIFLHVSSALCTHHQECMKTVHADSGTIVL